MRPFHWSLVASDLLTEQRPMHRSLGYIVVGLVGFRQIRALIGGRHARFVDVVAGPVRVLRYLRDILALSEDVIAGLGVAANAKNPVLQKAGRVSGPKDHGTGVLSVVLGTGSGEAVLDLQFSTLAGPKRRFAWRPRPHVQPAIARWHARLRLFPA